LAKCKERTEAIYYVQATQTYGWSRSVLMHQIESGLWQREGKAITNFEQTLPAAQSDLAHQMLKDPYKFDFLSLSKEHTERELETDLIAHITEFLLELGAGFAYIGRQVPLQVGERDFFLDLLFYHTRLHCHVVVELKTVDFEPEFAGKLNFYIKAVDEQLRGEGDQPTIGLLLCKSKDRLVADTHSATFKSRWACPPTPCPTHCPSRCAISCPALRRLNGSWGWKGLTRIRRKARAYKC
jgi:predicted nuclease of restriction endonuclease-like (RecB) superfamily